MRYTNHSPDTFADGTTEDRAYPVEVWSRDARRYVRQYTFPGKRVARIELDPNHVLIDIDRSNDVWLASPRVVAN